MGSAVNLYPWKQGFFEPVENFAKIRQKNY